jgi:hypothetical protein
MRIAQSNHSSCIGIGQYVVQLIYGLALYRLMFYG